MAVVKQDAAKVSKWVTFTMYSHTPFVMPHPLQNVVYTPSRVPHPICSDTPLRGLYLL